MVDDVMQQVLSGKNRQQIEDALGPSLSTHYFKSSGRDLIYHLGPERGWFGIDSEWLLIWLDATGRFHRAKLATD
jgi:hypothetical protein